MFRGILACLLAISTQAHGATNKRMFDVRVPMRDSVELATDIWVPSPAGRHPLILMRTPYGKVSQRATDYARYFVGHGYAFAVQDVRGRGASEGDFDFLSQEGDDGFDAIEWLARQPWSNGRICLMGSSYGAGIQWQAAKKRPPHLVCIAPVAAPGDVQNEVPYIGGAFREEWALDWLAYSTTRVAKLTTEDWLDVQAHRPLITNDEVMGHRERLYREWLEHPLPGAYWNRMTLSDADFAMIDLPVLTITGWFDSQLSGALYGWKGMERAGGKKNQYLVIGPWTHGQTSAGGGESLGNLQFSADSIIDPLALQRAFFDEYLLERQGSFAQPKVRIYIPGRNAWQESDAYREGTPTSFFLYSQGDANTIGGGGTLREDAPGGADDRFTFDPQHPVPLSTSLNGGTHGASYGMDRRAIEARKDILVYSSARLSAPMEVLGTGRVDLYAASDGRDTDFTASIIDVYPDGRAVLIGSKLTGIQRARYRNHLDHQQLLTPGKVEKYAIDLGPIGYSFGAGHRIRIEISSSAAPRYNPNPNTGDPIATDTEWRIAKQIVRHNRRYPSALVLPIVKP